ncbi:gamma-glutamylcyclotransferase family protein [Streptomyces apocyni]|uniref:gamma-glutamylcyclotransferase family protein n=1 Tax=Streptomyces apocyni TaxID=2654677 RepID=UPI0012EAB7C4|nr:gamma-glutamylcyclotransferase family protein [Streptomyces apocyni]
MTPLPFFVYGTLRTGARNHHALLLHERLAATEPGQLPDTVLFEGPGYPYAVEEPGCGGVVRGELLTALPAVYPALLQDLDRLEHHVPGDPRSLYDRVARDVTRLPDGTAVRAWVYLASARVARHLRATGTPIPSGDWLAHHPGG